ncbi:hypothetical protein SLS55_004998 [Diplodia seriata]|uniref:AAA+ ATPase domain-containing protein n=1 Tax=Diplodia seriata TaxID=420778 RepID=A0ABR3CLX7_9PEZI
MPPFKKEPPPQPPLSLFGRDASHNNGPNENDEISNLKKEILSSATVPKDYVDEPAEQEPEKKDEPEVDEVEIRSIITEDDNISAADRSREGHNSPVKPSIDGEDAESESDDESLTKMQQKARKKLESAEKQFTRKNGIIYVSDEAWVECRHYAQDCHLYVAAAANASSEETEARPGSQSPSSGKCHDVSAAENRVPLSYNLPARVRVMNKLLLREMGKVCGGISLNHDQLPPFRSIVPFERRLRQLHQKKEEEFSDLASAHPNDPTFQRNPSWVPRSIAYALATPLRDDDEPSSELDRPRILLEGLRALMHFLDNDLAPLINTYREIELGVVHRIPFAYLWHLFPPGQVIVSKDPKHQVYRVLQVTGGRKSLAPRRHSSRRSTRKTVSDLAIDCFHLDFDGKQFGAVPKTIFIRPYDDALPVTSLHAYPLQYENGVSEETLVERGMMFTELVKVRHRSYTGLSLKEGELFDRYDEIESDVIIDFELAFRNSEPRIQTPKFGSGVILKPTEEDEEETHAENISYDDEECLQLRWTQFIHNTTLLETQTFQNLSRDSFILLPYRVYGYVLLSRKWYPLDIDLVREAPSVKQGDNDGFEKLILPDGHKEIVRALVKTHARDGTTKNNNPVAQMSQRQFDVVKGKGKGLIILLHGAPGVGKTSTAECVAANAGRPLFPITCGDLGGTSAQEVERNLERFFDLARKWGCVLLLDEADVFLSTRTKGDISQNILVSGRLHTSTPAEQVTYAIAVFLRVLEYYSGILILTTNRVGDFDEAVKSRVHCALYYPPLDRKNTKEIWKMNLDLLDKQNASPDSNLHVRFDRDEILRYARRHWKDGNQWNGRQIKNAFQTAVALADWDDIKGSAGDDAAAAASTPGAGPQLTRKHFEMVARASAHFDMYLKSVRRDDVTRAKEDELRRDELRNNFPRPGGGGGGGRRAKSARAKDSYGGGKSSSKLVGSSDEAASSSDASSTQTTDVSSSTGSDSEPVRKKESRKSERRRKKKEY